MSEYAEKRAAAGEQDCGSRPGRPFVPFTGPGQAARLGRGWVVFGASGRDGAPQDGEAPLVLVLVDLAAGISPGDAAGSHSLNPGTPAQHSA